MKQTIDKIKKYAVALGSIATIGCATDIRATPFVLETPQATREEARRTIEWIFKKECDSYNVDDEGFLCVRNEKGWDDVRKSYILGEQCGAKWKNVVDVSSQRVINAYWLVIVTKTHSEEIHIRGGETAEQLANAMASYARVYNK